MVYKAYTLGEVYDLRRIQKSVSFLPDIQTKYANFFVGQNIEKQLLQAMVI
jgi:hypothetical protein